MNNVLVTGANGQLGGALKLIAKQSQNDFLFFFTDKQMLDITNFESVRRFVIQNNIHILINCAAYTHVDASEDAFEMANQINHLAVKNLAEIAKEQQLKFVHISTDYVFDGTASVPYLETDSTQPVNKYGLSKLLGEQAIQAVNPKNTLIIRTSWLYASKGRNFVNTMLRLGEERTTISVVNDQFGSPTYAVNLAKAILQLLPSIQNKEVEIFHYSDKGSCSWFEFSKEIMLLSNKRCTVQPIDTKAFPTKAKRPAYSVLNTQKIQTVFQISTMPWKEALQECVGEILS